MENSGIDAKTGYILRMKHAFAMYLEGCGFQRIARIMSKLSEKFIDIRLL